jgi:hypothetical protein
MGATVEISERTPWTIKGVLEQLDRIDAFASQRICRALCSEREALAAALRNTVQEQGGRRRVSAAAFLLMLNDKAGREPFLEALAGPDGDARNLAIDFVQYCFFPHDIELRDRAAAVCPISSDELFSVLKRDLHEPWTGLSLRALDIVTWQDYPQARPITRPLLAHPDRSLRRKIAGSYLRAGRDEGAFAVVEEILREASAYVPSSDPHSNDSYQTKGLWYFVEDAAVRGGAELRSKAAMLAMEFISQALDAPDSAQRFDFNHGLIRGANACKALAAVMPSGAKALLQRVISSHALSVYDRGEALMAYSQALGEEARPVVLSALRSEALRARAACAMERLTKGKNDSRDIAALSDALAREERPGVVAAVAKALLAAGPDGWPAIQAALDRSEPWAKMELSWRIRGGTDRELADLLAEAGVMDPITDEELTRALSKGFDIRSLIWAGGERFVIFHVKSSEGLEHFKLFQDLLKAARPTVTVENLKEIINANLLREPVAATPNVERVTDFGTVCTLSFQYEGKAFSFEVHPQGRWHDVASVMKGFDAFMKAIGRDDRCYEFEGGDEWAQLVVAPASKFEPVAASLGIPIERDSESARDAAKAYQRQIQNMYR